MKSSTSLTGTGEGSTCDNRCARRNPGPETQSIQVIDSTAVSNSHSDVIKQFSSKWDGCNPALICGIPVPGA
jgi:hypothetical protein